MPSIRRPTPTATAIRWGPKTISISNFVATFLNWPSSPLSHIKTQPSTRDTSNQNDEDNNIPPITYEIHCLLQYHLHKILASIIILLFMFYNHRDGSKFNRLPNSHSSNEAIAYFKPFL